MDHDDSWTARERAMRDRPSKRPSSVWFGPWPSLRALLGICVEVGPGSVAGYLGWSYWLAIAWGIAVAAPWRAILSEIYRGARLPPHWVAGLALASPPAMVLFVALNLLAYWLANWLAR